MNSTYPSERLPNSTDGTPQFYAGKDSCIDSGEDTLSTELRSRVPVRFSLNGPPVVVLFDTGARTSIMSSTFLARHFRSATIIPARTAEVIGLCRQKSYLIGHADVDIYLRCSSSPAGPATTDPAHQEPTSECLLRYKIRVDILGGPSPSFLLIGARFMREFDMTLDMKTRMLQTSWYYDTRKQTATVQFCSIPAVQPTEAEGAGACRGDNRDRNRRIDGAHDAWDGAGLLCSGRGVRALLLVLSRVWFG